MRFGALLLALVPLALAGWDVFCGDMSCPNVGVDITCSRPDHCYLAGGYSSSMMGVYETNDFVNWEESIMKGFTPMVMTIAASTAGPVAAGGMGAGNYSAILAAVDGKTFYNAKVPDVISGQDIKAIRNNATSASRAAFAFVGSNFLTGVDSLYLSNDGARSFARVELGSRNLARYGAYPTESTFFITLGTWPTSVKQRAADTLNHCLRKSQHICVPAGDLTMAQVRAHNAAVTSANGGYVGQILRSSNGGKTFETMFSTNEYYFNDIACSSATTCIAVGENLHTSMIMRTEDAGATWTEVFRQESQILTSLFRIRLAADGKTAFAAGGNADNTGLQGFIYGSTDGGRTWAVAHKQPGVAIFLGLSISDDGTYGAAIGSTDRQTTYVLRYSA